MGPVPLTLEMLGQERGGEREREREREFELEIFILQGLQFRFSQKPV